MVLSQLPIFFYHRLKFT